MNTIWLVTAIFHTHISQAEIPYLRGNMIRLSNGNPLFHNHSDKGFCHMYPLVQYKRMAEQAMLIGINQGADAVVQTLSDSHEAQLQLGNRTANVENIQLYCEQFPVVCSDHLYSYAIHQWLPLNQENFRKYQTTENLIGRITLLEKILTANILSFAKGVGIYFSQPIECHLQQITPGNVIRFKGMELVGFSGSFQCNVSLPDGIGLGKSASMGYGMITKIE